MKKRAAEKTTLLAEFIRQALGTHGDLLAAVGSCYAQFGYDDPYLPFHQELQMLTGYLEGVCSLGTLGEEHTGRLWVALPTILDVLHEESLELVCSLIPLEAHSQHMQDLREDGVEALAAFKARARFRAEERSDLGSQTGQVALFDQFTRMLLAIARRYPLILELDDLHWADHATLSLLFHLARLCARKGMGNEASRMLGEVYDWFSEASSTTNMQAAKALTAELKSTALA